MTLGTIRPYRFDRLVDRVMELLGPNDAVVWQLGSTTRRDLPGEAWISMSANEFDHHIAEADVVVTHAGVGSLLKVVESGKVPLVAARLQNKDEHVDNHQLQALAEFQRFGIAEDLMASDTSLRSVANVRVAKVEG